MKRIGFLSLIFMCFALSCSSGGSSSGSGGNVQSSSTTYTKDDLAGDWSYLALKQVGGGSCSGTMSFDKNARLVGITNSCCPGGQTLKPEFWFWSSGYVKGYNWAWCSDTSMLTKYSMDFTGFDKRMIKGLMDVHVSHEDGDAYTRFNILLTSLKPVVVIPAEPETPAQSQTKKPLRAPVQASSAAKK